MSTAIRILLCGIMLLGFPAGAQGPHVLVFHKQNGYIHTATPTVVATLTADWTAHGMTVETTIDSLAFTTTNLARFDVVVFLNTNYRNGPLLARAQEAAFEAYIRDGGAFVGLHSAIPLNGTMEEAIWPWYASLYGARFRSHAPYRAGYIIMEDTTHFSTSGLPVRLGVQDEWYALQVNPRGTPGTHILATVDETGFLPDSHMGGDHPVSWTRTFEGARAWITVVGHDMGAFANGHFQKHVRNGVLWAAGRDSGGTALRPERMRSARAASPGERSHAPLTTLSYMGRDGTRLSVRIDGRAVAARRVSPGASDGPPSPMSHSASPPPHR